MLMLWFCSEMRKGWLIWVGVIGMLSNSAASQEKSPFPVHDRAVAYAFNQGEGQLQSILHEGKLNPTTSEKLARPLKGKQLDELASFVTGERSKHEMADCYYPRHAVVFYLGKKPVGYVEVCFECYEYRSDIKGLAKTWDLSGLAGFFRALKFPVNWNDKLFKRLNPDARQ